MLVLQVIEGLGPGGAEKALVDYLGMLSSVDLHFVVARLFHSEGARYHDSDLARLGVPVVDIGLRNRWDVVRGVRRLSRLAQEMDVDVIHTHLWTADVVGRLAAGRAGVPAVSTMHNVTQLPDSEHHGRALRQFKVWGALVTDRWTARRAVAAVAVSDVVADWACAVLRLDPGRVVTIQNPVMPAPRVSRLNQPEFWASVGVGGAHRFHLLTVGRVSAQKDLLSAIRALAVLRSGGCDAVLVSAGALGDDGYVVQVRREIDGSGLQDAVFLLGPRHDVGDLLAHADVFVFPSIHEGMGIALAEAMLAGLPCVVADLAILRQVGGDQATYVPIRQPAELAAEIRSLLDDPERRHEMGDAARAAARARFDSRGSAVLLRDLYARVVREA